MSVAAKQTIQRGWIVGCGLLLIALVGRAADAPMPDDATQAAPPGRVVLDETVISGNQELPKVLYIVPWQQPTGLPEIELQMDFTEEALFRRLYPPAYQREMSYFETLQERHPQE